MPLYCRQRDVCNPVRSNAGAGCMEQTEQGKGKLALPIDKAFCWWQSFLLSYVWRSLILCRAGTLKHTLRPCAKPAKIMSMIFHHLSITFLAGHVSLGYALFLAMGYFIWPNAAQGVYAVNLLLSFAGFCCTWGILRHAVKRKTSLQLLLAAFLIWCMPLTLGPFPV